MYINFDDDLLIFTSKCFFLKKTQNLSCSISDSITKEKKAAIRIL